MTEVVIMQTPCNDLRCKLNAGGNGTKFCSRKQESCRSKSCAVRPHPKGEKRRDSGGGRG